VVMAGGWLDGEAGGLEPADELADVFPLPHGSKSCAPTTSARTASASVQGVLDGEAAACQSRRVKSCGPSGSQDLALLCGAAK
jgi:hypothetical protein